MTFFEGETAVHREVNQFLKKNNLFHSCKIFSKPNLLHWIHRKTRLKVNLVSFLSLSTYLMLSKLHWCTPIWFFSHLKKEQRIISDLWSSQLSNFIGAIISYTVWCTCLPVSHCSCQHRNVLLILPLLDHPLLLVFPFVPSVLLLSPLSDIFHSWTIIQTNSDNLKCDKWLSLFLFPSVSLSLFLDVYPNHHPDHLSQPVCLGVSGNALHAQSLHHPLPPWAECTQTKTQLQGEVVCMVKKKSASCDYVTFWQQVELLSKCNAQWGWPRTISE